MSYKKTLHVYSSGAVAPQVKKCAKELTAKLGTNFELIEGNSTMLCHLLDRHVDC